MQIAVIEFCRNVLGIQDANTEEVKSEGTQVIKYMPEIDKDMMGGTMRLGSRETHIIDPESLAAKMYYGQQLIKERHRHRYEVNTEFKE